MKLIDILSDSYKNLMIVGDPDQNIYEWRGSDVKLLVDFDKDHAGCQTIFLNQNYRSTPQILQCANFLIDKNEMRLKKDLFTLAANGTEVYHYHSKSDNEETAIISDTIKKLVKSQKYKYSDIAILYRSSFLSRIVEKKLVESGIPYEIFGGVKFFRRMEVLDVIAYLRLIEFDDDLSFKRIINTPRRKFGRGKMTSLETLRENEISIFMESESPRLYSTLKNHTGDSVFHNSGVGQFVSFIDNLRENKSTMRISQIVEEVCMNSGYEQYIRELGDEERLENLAELKRIASEFESNYGEEISLSEFLQLCIRGA
jgi:DNA helicase-2/ATP-dependent DNA helicase PcrA